MSARAHPAAPGAGDVIALLERGCPVEAGEMIRKLRDGLDDALVPKLDGTRHHRACLNRTVNASPTDCSDACDDAQVLIVWSDIFLKRHPKAAAPRQLRLEDAAGPRRVRREVV